MPRLKRSRVIVWIVIIGFSLILFYVAIPKPKKPEKHYSPPVERSENPYFTEIKRYMNAAHEVALDGDYCQAMEYASDALRLTEELEQSCFGSELKEVLKLKRAVRTSYFQYYGLCVR